MKHVEDGETQLQRSYPPLFAFRASRTSSTTTRARRTGWTRGCRGCRRSGPRSATTTSCRSGGSASTTRTTAPTTSTTSTGARSTRTRCSWPRRPSMQAEAGPTRASAPVQVGDWLLCGQGKEIFGSGPKRWDELSLTAALGVSPKGFVKSCLGSSASWWADSTGTFKNDINRTSRTDLMPQGVLSCFLCPLRNYLPQK